MKKIFYLSLSLAFLAIILACNPPIHYPLSCENSTTVIAFSDTVNIAFHNSLYDSIPQFPISIQVRDSLRDTIIIVAWFSGESYDESAGCYKNFEWKNDTLCLYYRTYLGLYNDSTSHSGHVLAKVLTSVPNLPFGIDSVRIYKSNIIYVNAIP